jgi:hypothetical protein
MITSVNLNFEKGVGLLIHDQSTGWNEVFLRQMLSPLKNCPLGARNCGRKGDKTDKTMNHQPENPFYTFS